MATALAVAALVAGVGTTVQAIEPHRAELVERLPDLDQETPAELEVKVLDSHAGPSYRLGFRSAVRNVGAGPLIVYGSRPNTETPFMTVDQLIDRSGEPARVVRDVGLMKYTISPGHRHWHYLQFDRYELQRYELLRAGSNEALITDRKTGFCLGDRYRAKTARRLQAASKRPVYTGSCGLGAPDRLYMQEGISVGWGDDYGAFLEGQDLPLDSLPDGRYVLVHRVNADRHLEEQSYANNAASVLLELRWWRGKPYLRVIATCPDSERCAAGDRPAAAAK